jgi:hypothetical protein
MIRYNEALFYTVDQAYTYALDDLVLSTRKHAVKLGATRPSGSLLYYKREQARESKE